MTVWRENAEIFAFFLACARHWEYVNGGMSGAMRKCLDWHYIDRILLSRIGARPFPWAPKWGAKKRDRYIISGLMTMEGAAMAVFDAHEKKKADDHLRKSKMKARPRAR